MCAEASFFMVFFLFMIFLFKFIDKELTLLKSLKHFISYMVILLSVMLCTVLPKFIYTLKEGRNLEAPIRKAYESELYGLKITRLFLPVEIRNIKILNKFYEDYTSHLPQFEATEYLGIIGIIGFSMLIFIILKKVKIKNDILLFLAQLNISAVLFSTIGGFGVLFSLLITPQIRGYNRISVYIAYFSILSTCVILTKLFEVKKFNKKYYVLIFLLFLFSIFEQIPINRNDYKSLIEAYNSDKNFIMKIENIMEKDAMIFQLPYYKFPESPPINNMGDYQLFVGYLHSKSLRWSYGGYKGRKSDLWNRYISSFPLEDMIQKISIAGFKGVYIDRKAYSLEEYTILEDKLEVILNNIKIISENGNLSFISMEKYNEIQKLKYSEKEINNKKEEILNLIINFDSGFYMMENAEEMKWQWSKKESTIFIMNLSSEKKYINLKTRAYSGYGELSKLYIELDGEKYTYEISDKGTDINFNINTNGKRINTIKLYTDAKKVIAPNDLRDLYFRLENLLIEFE